MGKLVHVTTVLELLMPAVSATVLKGEQGFEGGCAANRMLLHSLAIHVGRSDARCGVQP